LLLTVEDGDKAAQSLTSILEGLTVDAAIRAPDLGSQAIECGVQNLSEQFNIVVGQVELHRGLRLCDLSFGVEAR
jgi:hypothetical protein